MKILQLHYIYKIVVNYNYLVFFIIPFLEIKSLVPTLLRIATLIGNLLY